MNTTEQVADEIVQIIEQYKAEVGGVRKQWPRAVRSRVLQLLRSGLKPKLIAEQTGISRHTISLWQYRARKGALKGFNELSVLDGPSLQTLEMGKKSATVTVKQKSERLSPARNLSVTVTTPDGYFIQTESAEAAAAIICQLRGG